jgi:hypothetical protein
VSHHPIKVAAPWGGAPRSIRRSCPVEKEVTTSKLFRTTGNISRTSEKITSEKIIKI